MFSWKGSLPAPPATSRRDSRAKNQFTTNDNAAFEATFLFGRWRVRYDKISSNTQSIREGTPAFYVTAVARIISN